MLATAGLVPIAVAAGAVLEATSDPLLAVGVASLAVVAGCLVCFLLVEASVNAWFDAADVVEVD